MGSVLFVVIRSHFDETAPIYCLTHTMGVEPSLQKMKDEEGDTEVCRLLFIYCGECVVQYVHTVYFNEMSRM